ncbi:hypothetical protein ES707_11226 [subsurface metagenome]
MRKLLIGITAVAMLALLALPVMAVLEPNPWQGCCDVKVEIVIPEMAELWSDLGDAQERHSALAKPVKITNAGGIIPSEGIYQDTLKHISNINVAVSVALLGGIPPWTRFHVIVGPANRGAYNCVFAWGGIAGATFLLGAIPITNVDADKVITWDRRSDAYIGSELGTAYDAFTGVATTQIVPHAVDYAVDAINGMPIVGSRTPTVMWTITSG